MKKKILIISRFIPYTGGREVLLQGLLHHLSSEYDVYLLTPDVGYHSIEFMVVNFKTKKQLQKHIEEINPDIINIHTFYFAQDSLEISEKLQIPLILTLHGLFLENYDKQYFDQLIKIAKQATIVTVVCKLHKKDLVKAGIVEDKIYLIRNGVDVNKFKFKSLTKKIARRLLNVPLDEKIILASARFTPIKGLDYLIDALPKIKDKNFKLLISTPSGRYNQEEIEYRDKLMKKAEKLRMENKIIIQFHENTMMLFLYKACDVFVLPSIMEGTPLSLLEAMASKKACIATNVGGVSEILNDKNGYIVQAKNSSKIAEAINKALYSNNFILRRNAYRTIKKQFKEKDMFSGYEKLYNKLLKK